MAEFASKGVAGTALGLGIAGTVGLANQLMGGNCNGGIGLLGGNNNNCNQYETKEASCLREQLAEARAQNLARAAGDQSFRDSVTYASNLNDKQAIIIEKLSDGIIELKTEVATLKSDVRCLAAVNEQEHVAITNGYQSAVALESERRKCGDENLYAYVNATFVPGKLSMPLDSICPRPMAQCGCLESCN